jgi:hypothetical protein
MILPGGLATKNFVRKKADRIVSFYITIDVLRFLHLVQFNTCMFIFGYIADNE